MRDETVCHQLCHWTFSIQTKTETHLYTDVDEHHPAPLWRFRDATVTQIPAYLPAAVVDFTGRQQYVCIYQYIGSMWRRFLLAQGGRRLLINVREAATWQFCERATAVTYKGSFTPDPAPCGAVLRPVRCECDRALSLQTWQRLGRLADAATSAWSSVLRLRRGGSGTSVIVIVDELADVAVRTQQRFLVHSSVRVVDVRRTAPVHCAQPTSY